MQFLLPRLLIIKEPQVEEPDPVAVSSSSASNYEESQVVEPEPEAELSRVAELVTAAGEAEPEKVFCKWNK